MEDNFLQNWSEINGVTWHCFWLAQSDEIQSAQAIHVVSSYTAGNQKLLLLTYAVSNFCCDLVSRHICRTCDLTWSFLDTALAGSDVQALLNFWCTMLRAFSKESGLAGDMAGGSAIWGISGPGSSQNHKLTDFREICAKVVDVCWELCRNCWTFGIHISNFACFLAFDQQNWQNFRKSNGFRLEKGRNTVIPVKKSANEKPWPCSISR